MTHETHIELVLREARRLERLADGAIAQVPDDRFSTPIEEGGNSIAILAKHLSGNMRSRWTDFLTTDGEKPDRDRDTEFVLTAEDTRERLLERWRAGWAIFLDSVGSLEEADLDRVVTIRGEPHTVRQAIHRQLTHYAYHVGQIVLVARSLVGGDWRSLSVPKGESVTFNRNPDSYL